MLQTLLVDACSRAFISLADCLRRIENLSSFRSKVVHVRSSYTLKTKARKCGCVFDFHLTQNDEIKSRCDRIFF